MNKTKTAVVILTADLREMIREEVSRAMNSHMIAHVRELNEIKNELRRELKKPLLSIDNGAAVDEAPLSELRLPPRVVKRLYWRDVNTVGELTAMSRDEITRFSGISKVTVDIIENALAAVGRKLKENPTIHL